MNSNPYIINVNEASNPLGAWLDLESNSKQAYNDHFRYFNSPALKQKVFLVKDFIVRYANLNGIKILHDNIISDTRQTHKNCPFIRFKLLLSGRNNILTSSKFATQKDQFTLDFHPMALLKINKQCTLLRYNKCKGNESISGRIF